MATAGTSSKITPTMRAAFITALRENGGIARLAMRQVSSRVSVRTWYYLRERVESFRQEWEGAVADANADLEAEIHRRGVLGFEEERVDSKGNVTVLRRFSDACLLSMARARLPNYAKQEVALSGRVETTDTLTAELAAAVRAVAQERAPGLREDLDAAAEEVLRG